MGFVAGTTICGRLLVPESVVILSQRLILAGRLGIMLDNGLYRARFPSTGVDRSDLPTPGGRSGCWTAMTVKRICDRYGIGRNTGEIGAGSP